MDQDIVRVALNEIVQSVTLLSDSSEESLIKANLLTEAQENHETTCLCESAYSKNEIINITESKSSNKVCGSTSSEEAETYSADNAVEKSIDNHSVYIEDEPENPKESRKINFNLNDLEIISQKLKTKERVCDPTEIIEPYSSECSDTEKNVSDLEYKEKEFNLSKSGVNKKSKPYTTTNNEPSVIVINNYSGESGTESSDSEFHERDTSANKPCSRAVKSNKNISKESLNQSSCKKKLKYLQVNVQESVASTTIDSTDLNNKEVNVYKCKSDDRISNHCPLTEPYLTHISTTIETLQIVKLKRSPRIYGRREQLHQMDTEASSTSTNIVINGHSNESSSSMHSTGEMQKRTERNFAFLLDSDFSDVEIDEHTSGYQNRAYEPSDEIDLRSEEAELTSQIETDIPISELTSINFDNSYIWSTTGLFKVAQVICCIAMYISIDLCRFYSRYIQSFCVIGACVSGFLLMVYSYRIHSVYWKSFKVRLLLSEFMYLIIYAACDFVFATIKFEFNEQATYRERMATMILMTSTGIAAVTYCYNAILCYSLMEDAGRENHEEKKLIISYLPSCSQSSRAEMCDIFHTCIL